MYEILQAEGEVKWKVMYLEEGWKEIPTEKR